MKLIISNKQLQRALKKLGTIVPKRSILPALEHILVEASGNKALLKVTDTEATIIYEILMNENVSKEDTALIELHWLKGICDLHEDEPILIDALKTKTTVTTSSGVYTQEVSVKMKDFPPLPEKPTDSSTEMMQGFVKWMHSASTLCDSKDVTRVWRSCVYLELINNQMIVTTTDANSLFTHTFEIESTMNKSFMISQKVVNTLNGFNETTLFLNDDSFAFQSEEMTVITKIPEHKFPDYNKIIPNSDVTNIVVEREMMKAVLDKIKFINPDLVTITPSENEVVFHAENEKGATATLTLSPSKPYTGEAMDIKVNPSKLHLLLSQTSYELIGLGFQAPAKPLVITNTTSLSYIGLIMPLMA